MATNRAVKGYIFKEHSPVGTESYYLEFGMGITPIKEDAYVFTMSELEGVSVHGWGGKHNGTWIVVYE